MKSALWLLLALVSLSEVRASEPLAWPRFRGPNGSGIAEGQRPPVEFGPQRNVKWKVAAPGGLSSPIVVGELLVITAFDQEKLWTIAYRRTDGSEAWRAAAPVRELETYHEQEGSPAASTPATDGERIVSYFGSSGLVCYDLTGKELWRYELPAANPPGGFGSGVSPIIVDGLVILVRDVDKQAKIIALDVATGERKWETDRDSPVSWCTPVVVESPQGRQIVAAGPRRMVSYDLQSGRETWFIGGMPSGVCASPVAADGRIYFAGWAPGGAGDPDGGLPKYDDLLKGYDKDQDGVLSVEEGDKDFAGFLASQDSDKDGKVTREEYEAVLKYMAEGVNSALSVDAGGSGDVSDSHIRWRQTKGLPYVASGVLCEGQYVVVKDGGIVTAYDAATGKEVYTRRAAGNGRYYASPVAAGGHIYFTSLDDGTVTVLKAGAEQPEVAAQNESLGERVAATPAIADDTIYIRGEAHIYAFAERE